MTITYRHLRAALIGLTLLAATGLLAQTGIPPGYAPVAVVPGSANQVYAIDGTAALPSISFATQRTSGLHLGPGSVPTMSSNGVDQAAWYTDILQMKSTVALGWSSGAINASTDTQLTRVAAGEFGWTAVAFASLGAPANGTFAYCSDCTIANPCAGAGTGALAKRLNGVWVCS